MARRWSEAKFVGGKIELPCIFCKQPFLTTRLDAQFCSQNCRKAWSRRKDEVTRRSREVMRSLQALRTLLKKYPDLTLSITQELRRHRMEIDDLLRLRPDDDEKALMDMKYDLARRRDV